MAQSMIKNIKLILEYDGTNYHGWQSQSRSSGSTIQGTLEQAIRELSYEDIRTNSSGRTDAGVHALGHVANFKTGHSMPPEAWAPALNHFLPADIKVIASVEVPDDFHARFSAVGKIYLYRILNRTAPTALYRHVSWHVPMRLNVRKMRSAASVLIGTHDFSSFRSSGCSAKSPIRTIKSLNVNKRGDFIEILVEADAFLQYMARNIVGTLVEVGLGRFTAEQVGSLLLSCDRSKAGRTAPSQGLCLIKVFYSELRCMDRSQK
jgi:tRNA pseudouridine38-40 synthase